MKESFVKELEELINRHSLETGCDTPDFILAKYLEKCLYNYMETVNARDKWFGVDMWSADKLKT